MPAACDACRYCSELLIDAYRWPDVDSTQRNYTYMEAVTRYLGNQTPKLYCPSCSYANLPQTVLQLLSTVQCLREPRPLWNDICRQGICHLLWSHPM